jgi:hypothetical protein
MDVGGMIGGTVGVGALGEDAALHALKPISASTSKKSTALFVFTIAPL